MKTILTRSVLLIVTAGCSGIASNDEFAHDEHVKTGEVVAPTGALMDDGDDSGDEKYTPGLTGHTGGLTDLQFALEDIEGQGDAGGHPISTHTASAASRAYRDPAPLPPLASYIQPDQSAFPPVFGQTLPPNPHANPNPPPQAAPNDDYNTPPRRPSTACPPRPRRP